MSLASTSAYAVEVERRNAAPAQFTALEYPYAPRVTRRDWRMLLASWEQLQPNADRGVRGTTDSRDTPAMEGSPRDRRHGRSERRVRQFPRLADHAHP